MVRVVSSGVQPDGSGAGIMITEQQLADIAAHMAMRLGQAGGRIAAKHPKAAKDGELASMLNDLDDHIIALTDTEQS